jgi:ribosomal protein S4E
MNIGEKVKVNKPSWRDASGSIHGPGKNHGRVGIITDITGQYSGSDEIVHVSFSQNEHIYVEWVSDLKIYLRLEG